MEPENTDNCVILANLCSQAKRWEEGGIFGFWNAVSEWKRTVLGEENQILVTISFQVLFHIAKKGQN